MGRILGGALARNAVALASERGFEKRSAGRGGSVWWRGARAAVFKSAFRRKASPEWLVQKSAVGHCQPAGTKRDERGRVLENAGAWVIRGRTRARGVVRGAGVSQVLPVAPGSGRLMDTAVGLVPWGMG